MTYNALELALSYARAGVSVFPCRAAPEEIMDPATGEFSVLGPKTPLLGNGFRGATKNERIIRVLFGERFPDALVGAPTGELMGGWVLDIDVHTDDSGQVVNGYHTIAALEEKFGPLPRTAVSRTAGGGEHHFYRYSAGVRNRGKIGLGADVRGAGGYVIMPGSVVADGRQYSWIDWEDDGLPPLPEAPSWLLDLVLPPATVTSSTDYHYTPGDNSAYVERAVEAELSALSSAPQGTRGEAVNSSAFSLGTLVGAGALSRAEAEAGLLDAAYANGVVAKDGEKEIKAKIKRGLNAGIKQPRQIPEPSAPAGWGTVDVTALVANAERKRLAKLEPAPTADLPTPTDDEDLPTYNLEAIADLESLTYPGGLVEDLIDWIVSSAEQPSRTLAMAAVLPLVASLAGARYSAGSRDTRPNIYIVALADSGFGKEHARSQIKRILMADQGMFADFSGPARIMSASALREVLEANPSVNCQIDEFGGFIRNITDRKAGSHQQAISTDLRDYYSASSTFFEGAAYRGSPPKRIYNPNLCIHGTSTPEQFWTALSSASAEDGLLPRLILFHVAGEKPATVKPTRDVRDVPLLLMERMLDVAGLNAVEKRSAGRGNLSGRLPPKSENRPHIIPFTEDALLLLGSVKEAIDEHERRVAPEGRPFVRRIVENAIKLAMIVSVGRDPKGPAITADVFEWAAAVAWTCAAAMLAEVLERLSDNQREANYKRIISLIKKAGEAGLTEARLFDRCKAIDARQRQEIVGELLKVGSVAMVKGAKTPRMRWAGG